MNRKLFYSSALRSIRFSEEAGLMSLANVVAILIVIGRLLTAGVLVLAAIAKLRAGPDRFGRAILGYDLLSERLAWLLARWLPWIEMICGILLVIGFQSRMAVMLASGLLLFFSGAIILSLLRGRTHDCGCFGNGAPVQWRLVYRNLALMGILLPVYAFDGGAQSLDAGISLWPDYGFDPRLAFLGLAITWIISLSATVLFQFFTRVKFLKPTGKGEPV